jgi:predicted transcriptional regulator
MEHADPKTQLVVVLAASQKGFVVDAAKQAGAHSLSAFIRGAVLEKARAVLGDIPVPLATPLRASKLRPSAILTAYVGDAAPPNTVAPSVTLPSLHAFAAHLCDRNRAILAWIGTHDAESIHDLSRRFDYSYAGLSRTLGTLAAFGIVGYDTGADARCQPPRLLCHRVRLQLVFHEVPHPRILRIILGATPAKGVDVFCMTMDDFSKVVTDRGYDLLRLIAEHDPPTIGALGKLTGRTSQNAYPLLRRLAKFGLVGIEGSSRKKKPILLYDGLTFEVDLLA